MPQNYEYIRALPNITRGEFSHFSLSNLVWVLLVLAPLLGLFGIKSRNIEIYCEKADAEIKKLSRTAQHFTLSKRASRIVDMREILLRIKRPNAIFSY